MLDELVEDSGSESRLHDSHMDPDSDMEGKSKNVTTSTFAHYNYNWS